MTNQIIRSSRVALVRGPIVSTVRAANNEATPCIGLAYVVLVGIAGIGVIMIRAVRERRRQVGVLRALGVQAAAVRRAFVFSDSPDRAALIASAASLGLWALHPGRAYVTPELVAAAHAAGLRLNAWTVNDQSEIAAFAALGVDGIISNWPERIPKT